MKPKTSRLPSMLPALVIAALTVISPITFANELSNAASAAEIRSLTGGLTIWKRKNCSVSRGTNLNEDAPCGLPEAVSPNLPVELTFRVPTADGQHQVVDEEFTSGEWKIRLLLVWVQRPGEVPYLVTQTRLSRENVGVIAECSRYDAIDAFSFLPPGSCAGRDQGVLYGVSLIGKP